MAFQRGSGVQVLKRCVGNSLRPKSRPIRLIRSFRYRSAWLTKAYAMQVPRPPCARPSLQVLSSFRCNREGSSMYDIRSVPALLACVGRLISASQWAAVQDRLEAHCRPAELLALQDDRHDSQASAVSGEGSSDTQRSSDSDPVGLSVVSLCQTLSARQLMNKCAPMTTELFSSLCQEDQLYQISVRDALIGKLKQDLSEAGSLGTGRGKTREE